MPDFDHERHQGPTIRAVARALGVSEATLVAAATNVAGFPLEMSALQQLLDLIEAFTEIDDHKTRQRCVDFVRGTQAV